MTFTAHTLCPNQFIFTYRRLKCLGSGTLSFHGRGRETHSSNGHAALSGFLQGIRMQMKASCACLPSRNWGGIMEAVARIQFPEPHAIF